MATNRKLVAAYKHRRVKTFKCGKFKFEDHILKIYSEAEHEEFKRTYKGLLGIDKQAIVEVLQLENERPVNLSRRIDGAASTSKMVDSAETKAPAETEKEPAETPDGEAGQEELPKVAPGISLIRPKT